MTTINSNSKNKNYSNYSSYIARKTGILNYKSIINNKNYKQYNKVNTTFKLNEQNKIVNFNSYNSANLINNVKELFDVKCILSSNNPFSYDNDQYIINFLDNNLSNPQCPTNITILESNIYFNKINNITGENDNEFVDIDNLINFQNIEKYNIGLLYGFTISAEKLDSLDIKQYDRENIDISYSNINYITNVIYKNNWNINDISFNINNNFSLNNNTIIYPEQKYVIKNYLVKYIDNRECINNTIVTFNTPYPKRNEVNDLEYNVTIQSISDNILTENIDLLSSVNDFSYETLFINNKKYNVFYTDFNFASTNAVNFKILLNKKVFIGKTNNINEDMCGNVGKELSGNLCYFNLKLLNNFSEIITNYDISTDYFTGYDIDFANQNNKSIDSNNYLDIILSNVLDIADSTNDEYNKIRNYYLGIDICNIVIKDLSLSLLNLNTTNNTINLDNKFTLQIEQIFSDSSILTKNIDFILVNKSSVITEKTIINGYINLINPRLTSLDSVTFNNQTTFTNYNISLEVDYDISLGIFEYLLFNEEYIATFDSKFDVLYNNGSSNTNTLSKTININTDLIIENNINTTITVKFNDIFQVGNNSNIIITDFEINKLDSSINYINNSYYDYINLDKNI